MANSRIITFQDLDDAMPQLRLKLRKTAENLSAKKPASSNFLNKTRQFAESLFSNAGSDIVLDTKISRESRNRNKRKIDELIDSMIDKVNKQGDEVKSELNNLTQKQQENVLKFWAAIHEFFMDILQWLRDIFSLVIKRIREGFTIAKDAVNALFDKVMSLVNIIF